jgi:hypothetical protein
MAETAKFSTTDYRLQPPSMVLLDGPARIMFDRTRIKLCDGR